MWRWCLLFALHLTEKATSPFSLPFLHLNSFFSSWSVQCCSCLTQVAPLPHLRALKTSLLEIHNVTQPWITLVSFTAASIISSSSRLTGKSLDIGTSLHITMWFSWVLVVPSPNPHNSSSSILPVPHNLLFWDLFISRSIIMRLVPQLIQEELLKLSSEKEMKTMLITSETVQGKANHQLLFFLLFLFIVTVVIISYKL